MDEQKIREAVQTLTGHSHELSAIVEDFRGWFIAQRARGLAEKGLEPDELKALDCHLETSLEHIYDRLETFDETRQADEIALMDLINPVDPQLINDLLDDLRRGA